MIEPVQVHVYQSSLFKLSCFLFIPANLGKFRAWQHFVCRTLRGSVHQQIRESPLKKKQRKDAKAQRGNPQPKMN